jgi:hypothetical protein
LSDSSGASEIPEEVIAELVAEYEQGASSKDLARRHGYTRQAVRRALEGRVAPREVTPYVAPYTPPRKRQKVQPERRTGRHRNRKQVPLSIPVSEAAARATERAREREEARKKRTEAILKSQAEREEQHKARVEAEWDKLKNLRRLLAQLTSSREGFQSINQEAARINRAMADLVADDPGNMETEDYFIDLSVLKQKQPKRRYRL